MSYLLRYSRDQALATRRLATPTCAAHPLAQAYLLVLLLQPAGAGPVKVCMAVDMICIVVCTRLVVFNLVFIVHISAVHC